MFTSGLGSQIKNKCTSSLSKCMSENAWKCTLPKQESPGTRLEVALFLVAVAIKEAIQNACLERMASMEGPSPFANNYSLGPMDAQAR